MTSFIITLVALELTIMGVYSYYKQRGGIRRAFIRK